MRLNAKTAKALRGAAGYRNQTATPSRPEFPGVARLYSAPVYMKRASFSSAYQRVNGAMEKVQIKRTSMAVTGHTGRVQNIPLEMERKFHPPTIDIQKPDGTTVTVEHPHAGEAYMEPRLEIIAVTKKVEATGPKKQYRQLKRLHRKDALAAAARFNAPMEAA